MQTPVPPWAGNGAAGRLGLALGSMPPPQLVTRLLRVANLPGLIYLCDICAPQQFSGE